MKSDTFIRHTRIKASAAEVFAWHMRPGALERLTPPWEKVEVLEQAAEIAPGSRTVLRVRLGPISTRWVAEHRDIIPDSQFRDVQVEGPFTTWEHTHRMIPTDSGECVLEDRIDYKLPGGAIGRFFGNNSIKRKLKRMFAHRHDITAQDVERQAARPHSSETGRVLISGATGLVGSTLQPLLTTSEYATVALSRASTDQEGERVSWDPTTGTLATGDLEGFDAVVHLAGENIASGRWTKKKKKMIRDSRVLGTRLLSEKLASLDRPPAVLVSASAIGFYGDRGDEWLDESVKPGEGFLATTCQEWEAATEAAEQAGIRVVHLRFGVILSPAGGALARMLTPFKLGVGGKVGSGKQFMSWIGIDDAALAIVHAIENTDVRGPVNGVSTSPVTNLEFTKTLGRVLRKPTVFPMPAVAARLAFGELADELLLASARVKPNRLLESGFEFRHPDLEGVLRHLLGR